MTVTIGSPPFPHFPYQKCNVPPGASFTVRYQFGLCLLLRGAFPPCQHAWGVETVNIFSSWETFRRHLLQSHAPERCIKRVAVLTESIVKMHEYPAAYGGFSDIWSCQLLHMQHPPERVAVKALRPMIANKKEYQVKKKAVDQELNVWGGLTHKNILPLYGVTHGFGPFLAFVCPWAENGTLSEYLEKFETQLDLKKRLTLLGDIAAGLQYLHSRNVVHGDLSGSNVLITKSGRACLSDFGLSTLVEQFLDTTVSGISFPGNIRWAAPELLEECREGRPTTQLSSRRADIYSFGSITLQILSGKLPFHGVQRVVQIVIMISRGTKPSREPAWDGRAIPDVLWNFVESCWATPCTRPTSEEIVDFIARQLSGM
ncbi:Protein kinase-like domain containing protein [Tylopilus felleus]